MDDERPTAADDDGPSSWADQHDSHLRTTYKIHELEEEGAATANARAQNAAAAAADKASGRATGDNTRVAPMRAVCGDDFRLYSGEDAMAKDYVLQGGDGVISVTANVAPRAMHELCAAAMRGDVETARRIHMQLLSVHKNLFVEANPIPVKWALQAMGKMEGGIRLPLTPLAPQYHEVVRASLKDAGLLS